MFSRVLSIHVLMPTFVSSRSWPDNAGRRSTGGLQRLLGIMRLMGIKRLLGMIKRLSRIKSLDLDERFQHGQPGLFRISVGPPPHL